MHKSAYTMFETFRITNKNILRIRISIQREIIGCQVGCIENKNSQEMNKKKPLVGEKITHLLFFVYIQVLSSDSVRFNGCCFFSLKRCYYFEIHYEKTVLFVT